MESADDGTTPQTSVAAPGDASPRGFCFAVVLWEEPFRDLFLQLCLPSLLAPGNIPALDERVRAASQFLICTTAADAEFIAAHPAFGALAELITPEFIDIGETPPDCDRYRRMSQGQLLAARRIFDKRAYGVFLCPDAVLSDGAVAYLMRQAAAGTKVVLVPAIRFAQEPILAELRAQDILHDGQPIALSSRVLAKVGLKHLHPETLRYEWASPSFAAFPVSCFWRVAGGDGIVLHTFSWGPLLLDYGALAEHRTECLERWTMDGDYAFDNFGDDQNGIHVVTNSDDMLYLSVTPEGARPSPATRNWAKRASLRVATYSPIIDMLKRRLFRLSVRLHSGDLGPKWDRAEQRIDALIDGTLRPPRAYERVWCQYFAEGLPGLLRHLRDWMNNRRVSDRRPDT